MSSFFGLSVCLLAGLASAQGILFSEGFESGAIPSAWERQYPTSYSSEVVKSPVRAGAYALKTSLHKDDSEVKNGTRAEIKIKGKDGGEGSLRWYGFSIYIPGDHSADGGSEVLAQWHQDAGFGNPALAFRADGDQWKITGKVGKLHATPDQTRWMDYWGGACRRGVWTDWVVNIKWSGKSDGFLKVWKDGVRVVDYNGPVKYEDDGVASWKLGIYKADWNGDSKDAPGPPSRTVYHDEIRIGDANSGYDAVKPGVPGSNALGPLIASSPMNGTISMWVLGNGMARLKWNAGREGKAKIRIFNPRGQETFFLVTRVSEGVNDMEIKTGSLHLGRYPVKVLLEDKGFAF